MYLLYAVVMIWAHPQFIYPFADAPFSNPQFESVQLAETHAHLQVHDGADDAPAVLYFMGNGGALAYFQPNLAVHADADRSLVALEYPGGGGIPGTPSEVLLKAQALEVYDYLAEHHDGSIVVHGYSLGTGLALYVASEREVDAVILDAPYARMCNLMTAASWLPACYLPSVQRWNSLEFVYRIDAPVLILHGTADTLIPLKEGTRLAQAMERAQVAVTFAEIPGATHHNLAMQSMYSVRINEFLEGLTTNAQ
ncbi:hypothetical protein CLV80_103178 [Yoonia maritima]|uniref:Dienelactone hydrolase domain-containing protein n=2 Tax=Yoonia maritima TaxID=1435347 RepID=A0A2T0W1G4_9RHOB|nr:hypothetical protein CLV80_103178 [Yoonia maritima]